MNALLVEALKYLVAHPDEVKAVAAAVPELVADVKAVIDAVHNQK